VADVLSCGHNVQCVVPMGKGCIKYTSQINNPQKQYILKWSKEADRYSRETHEAFPVSPVRSIPITWLIWSVKTDSPTDVKLQDVQRATQSLVSMPP
jgi:hypothetical protein